MTRYSKQYGRLWGLSGNPFPDHAIASAGQVSYPFYENLYPGIGSKMARAFLGANGTSPAVAFLWSLGEGEEARGYGKTSHLLWFADRVNIDLGKSVARLAGRSNRCDSWIAAYAAFNCAEGLSLSNLLFDVARDLVSARKETLVGLRDAAYRKGQSSTDLYAAAIRVLCGTTDRWSSQILWLLCHGRPDDWIDYLDNRYQFSQWHKARYGPELLRSCVAFLRQLGIQQLLILVDQVEDFASFMTPAYKLRRDFPRLAYLCSADRILGGHLTFVLTMHPRAARILSRYWPDQDLGPVGVDGSLENVVRLGAMTRTQFKELVKTYLDAARLEGPTKTLAPYADSVIDLVYELNNGKPGYCLQALNFILYTAVSEGVRTIELQFAERCLVGQLQPTGEA